MLMDLKSYLEVRNSASLTEISRHFATDPDALRPMLDHWIRKGRVRRSARSNCGGCCACAPADVEFYEWAEPSPAAKPKPGSSHE